MPSGRQRERVRRRVSPLGSGEGAAVGGRPQKGEEGADEKEATMTDSAPKLKTLPAWQALASHCDKIEGVHLRQLFKNDATRGEKLTVEAAGLFLDYSKNRITDETLKLLVQLADASGLRSRIDAMFRGEKINVTENRAVLHV